MNTKTLYIYRDASNNNPYNEVVIEGKVFAESVARPTAEKLAAMGE